MVISLDAINRRISTRSYAALPLSAAEESAIRDAFEESSPGPFGGSPRFILASSRDTGIGTPGAGLGQKIGTYGFIKGATSFVLGAIARAPFSMEDFGYCLEGVILRATELGLGTCWLGGTFNRGAIASILQSRDDELVPAITPIGLPADRRSLMDRIVRRSARGDDRKPAGDLFFEAETRLPLAIEGPWATVLEAVRSGPSASNKQPWRIFHARGRPQDQGSEVFHLYLEEDRLYNSALGENKMQDVDMGIAMRHFEAAARALGLPGFWRRFESAPLSLVSSQRYIASWSA